MSNLKQFTITAGSLVVPANTITSFVVPTGITSISVSGTASGGAGGNGASSSGAGGGGGGSGAYIVNKKFTVVPDAVYLINTNLSVSIGSLVVLGAGVLGSNAVTTTGGAGGAGGTSATTGAVNGTAGSTGASGSLGVGGTGGSNGFGTGGAASVAGAQGSGGGGQTGYNVSGVPVGVGGSSYLNITW